MKVKATKTQPEQTAFFSNSACAIVTEGTAEEWRNRWSKNLPSKIVEFYTCEMILVSNPDELTAQRIRNRQVRIQDQLEDFFRTYLYVACYGETRHIRYNDNKIKKALNSMDYQCRNGRHNSWQVAYDNLKTINENHLKHNVQTMSNLFKYDGAYGVGFGGKKWLTIADTLSSFINGETSGKIFVDTCISLCHNNQFFIDKILNEASPAMSYLNLKFSAPDLSEYWDILTEKRYVEKYSDIEYLKNYPHITAIIEEYKPIVLELIGG